MADARGFPADADRFGASSSSINASIAALPPSLLRSTSAATSASARRTTTFTDFLSDSEDENDDDDDHDVQRMQQQADDMTYFQDAAFVGGSPADDDSGLLGTSPDDHSFHMALPPPPPPPSAPATDTSSSRGTRTSRRTMGRLTNVRASAVLWRLTSLKPRRPKRNKKKTNGSDALPVVGTLSNRGGVILDSDESESDRGSQATDGDVDGLHDSDEDMGEHTNPPTEINRLSEYSEHNSSFASSYGGGVDPNDDSFASVDRSFVSDRGNDDSFYGGGGGDPNDSSFGRQHPTTNDHSFYRREDEEAEEDDGMDLHDHDHDHDNSFSAAMVLPPHDLDDDDEFTYDDDGYDAEEEEQRRREKDAAVREHEQEQLLLRQQQQQQEEHARLSQRISYRSSHRSSHRLRQSDEPVFAPVVRASAAMGFEELELELEQPPNPYAASSSFDSVASSSSGGHFFVESLRGSSDSIAPLMDLAASPAPSLGLRNSGIMGSSGGGSTPSLSTSLLARRSADLSFRTSFVSVSQPFFPASSIPSSHPLTDPALAALGVRVVDHTHTQTPESPVVPSARLSQEQDQRASSSSSSSLSSAGSSMDNASFSSTIDDSFVERPRSSSADENLSFLFHNHVVSGCDDPATVADAVAAVDHTMAAGRQAKEKEKEDVTPPAFATVAEPKASKDTVVPVAVVPVKVMPPPSPVPAQAAPPVITVQTLPPVADAVRNSTVPIDLENRKTTKFARPLPPARRKSPPQAVAAPATAPAPAAVASSPPRPSVAIDTSMASSRASDIRLDFTGVFLGEVEDIVVSRPPSMSVPREPSQAEVVPTEALEPLLPVIVKETTAPAVSTSGDPPSMRRLVSAQQVSERKVEEFFRKTYLHNDADGDLADYLLLSGSTRTRSKTTANRAMAGATAVPTHEPESTLLVSTRSRRSSTSAMLTMDLKHVKGHRIEDLLRANEEESKDDYEAYPEEDQEDNNSETPVRKRTLSRPSVRFPIHEDLLEEKYPLRESNASSIALANRQPPPDRPHGEPHTPLSAYSVTSGSSHADSTVIQRNFTLSLASGTINRSDYSISPRTEAGTEHSSPHAIPMPPTYMLSPQHHRMSSSSSSIGSFSSETDGFHKHAPLTPLQLPTLTVNAQSVRSAHGATATATAAKLASSGVSQFSMSSSSRNPMAMSSNAVAPGFRWHPDLSQDDPSSLPNSHLHAPGTKQSHDSNTSSDDGSLSIKESIWHAAGALSLGSARPSMAASVSSHLQRASATLQTSFQRMRAQFRPPVRHPHANEVTSPQSIVAAPPQLPRGFDDRAFYKRLGNIPCGDAMIVVRKTDRGNAAKERAMAKHRATHSWLLLLGILFGVVVGIGLTQIDAVAPQFRVVVNERTGERSLPAGATWLLMPGSLFLRIWNCVTLPLLFCHVVNGMAELTMTQKAASVLSLRTLMYLVLTAALTTLEGVGLTFVFHTLGVFKGAQAPLRVAAASVKASVHVLDRVPGMAAMLCAAGESYLQASTTGQDWRCSNDSMPLPVQSGINITGTGDWRGSSPAVFAFTAVPTVLSASASTSASALASASAAYYPSASSSISSVVLELIALLSPGNVAEAFTTSSASSIVVVAVVVGLVVGLRAFHRAITAQHLLQQLQSQSQPHSHRTKETIWAESLLAKPHPILGVVIEIQQLLEWLAETLQCLAPIGVASLLAGHIVLHRDEWFFIPPPVLSLVLGVLGAAVFHMLVLAPLLVQLWTGGTRTMLTAWASLPAFLPAVGLSFATGNVAASVPVLAQNFAAATIVTKSMAQVGVGLGVAVLRTGNALYYPLAMLFLLETTAPDGVVPLTPVVVLTLTGLTFLSCFFAVGPGPKLGLPGTSASAHLQLVLLLFRAWTKQQLSGSGTLPLLVVADVVLGHVVAMVSTYDHVMLSRLMAEHSAELCIAPSEATLEVGASPVYL